MTFAHTIVHQNKDSGLMSVSEPTLWGVGKLKKKFINSISILYFFLCPFINNLNQKFYYLLNNNILILYLKCSHDTFFLLFFSRFSNFKLIQETKCISSTN